MGVVVLVSLGVDFIPDFDSLKQKADQESVTVSADIDGDTGRTGTGRRQSSGGVASFLAGGVVGLLAGLLTQFEGVEALLGLATNLLGSFLLPTIVSIFTLLRPFIQAFNKALPFILDFARNPAEGFTELFDSLLQGILSLPELIFPDFFGSSRNESQNLLTPEGQITTAIRAVQNPRRTLSGIGGFLQDPAGTLFEATQAGQRILNNEVTINNQGLITEQTQRQLSRSVMTELPTG